MDALREMVKTLMVTAGPLTHAYGSVPDLKALDLDETDKATLAKLMPLFERVCNAITLLTPGYGDLVNAIKTKLGINVADLDLEQTRAFSLYCTSCYLFQRIIKQHGFTLDDMEPEKMPTLSDSATEEEGERVLAWQMAYMLSVEMLAAVNILFGDDDEVG